jgi:hypothetical protein
LAAHARTVTTPQWYFNQSKVSLRDP